jgi:hypothetical protein
LRGHDYAEWRRKSASRDGLPRQFMETWANSFSPFQWHRDRQRSSTRQVRSGVIVSTSSGAYTDPVRGLHGVQPGHPPAIQELAIAHGKADQTSGMRVMGDGQVWPHRTSCT